LQKAETELQKAREHEDSMDSFDLHMKQKQAATQPQTASAKTATPLDTDSKEKVKSLEMQCA